MTPSNETAVMERLLADGVVLEVGYRGRTVHHIAKAVQAADALLVDVRLVAPYNRPHSPKLYLDALGDRYLHARGFGNLNYKNGGPIELAKPEDAFMMVADRCCACGASSLALMCACKDLATCHRFEVIRWLTHRIVAPIRSEPLFPEPPMLW